MTATEAHLVDCHRPNSKVVGLVFIDGKIVFLPWMVNLSGILVNIL